jgi:hypothetical protein
LAKPDSERLPESSAPIDTALVLSGPDSALARRLIVASRHGPNGPSDLVRDRAAWALSQARDGRLVEPLLAALDARDWRVCAYAAWALAGTPDPRVIPRLIALLQHTVWRLRAMAAFAIRVSEDPRAEAAMTAALVDPAWQVREEAVEYFGAVGGVARAEQNRGPASPTATWPCALRHSGPSSTDRRSIHEARHDPNVLSVIKLTVRSASALLLLAVHETEGRAQTSTRDTLDRAFPIELDRYIAQSVVDWDLPGVAIAIVRNDSTLVAKGYGVRELGKPDRVDENTVFDVASLSKAFTSTAAAILVDRGMLAWDEPVRRSFPISSSPIPSARARPRCAISSPTAPASSPPT